MNGKGRTAARRGSDLDAAVVRAGDAAHGRQSEARTAIVGGEKGTKDALEIFRRNSFSVVGHLDDHLIGSARMVVERDADFAAAVNSLDGVEQQVEHGVFDLCRI